MQKERELATIYQRTRNAYGTTTAPSAQSTGVSATATPAQSVDTAATALVASNTQDIEMQYMVLDQPVAITANEGLFSMNGSTPEQPSATETTTMDPQTLAMRPPKPTHTISSNSATASESRLAAETPDQSYVHKPHSIRTNWGKLKEKTRKDHSKRRDVLTAVNPDSCFCCPCDSNEEAHQAAATIERYDYGSSDEDMEEDNADSSEDDHNDHISKKELRDMVLAAAKTALEMNKRSTRMVQRGNRDATPEEGPSRILGGPA